MRETNRRTIKVRRSATNRPHAAILAQEPLKMARLFRITLVVFLAMTPTVGRAADPAFSFECVDPVIGKDFLHIEYSDVELMRQDGDVLIYRAIKAGRTYLIEIDACTTQVLSETPAKR